MQKLTKKRLFLYSLLLSGLIYLMVRILWGVSAPLRGNYYALIAVLFAFTLGASVAGYAILQRKAAVIAAGSTAILFLGVYRLIAAIADSLLTGVLLVSLGILGGAGVLYGLYRLLINVKCRWIVAISIIIASIALNLAATLAGLYIVRLSFAS